MKTIEIQSLFRLDLFLDLLHQCELETTLVYKLALVLNQIVFVSNLTN